MTILKYSPGARFPTWSVFWRGAGSTRAGLKALLWAMLRLLIAIWLWNAALRLARYQPPLKTVGLILAIICVGLVVWSAWGLWKTLRTLGIRRLVVVLLSGLALAVTVGILTAPSDRPLGERILTQVGATVEHLWESSLRAVGIVLRAPDDFLFAYTGRRALQAMPAGYPIPDPQATPIEFIVSGKSGSPPPLALRIGNTARVAASTSTETLCARAEPTVYSAVAARLTKGATVEVLEGPMLADGYKWWKVRASQGEGWCVASQLVVVR